MTRPLWPRRGWRAPAALVALAVVACSPAPSATPGLVETSSLGVPVSGAPTGLPSTPDPVASSASPLPPATSPTQSPAEPLPASPVSGVLTGIDTAGLDQVSGFTLRLDDGREIAFLLGDLENEVEFPPGHLGEHLASVSPVRVFFRGEGAGLVVYRLEDAE